MNVLDKLRMADDREFCVAVPRSPFLLLVPFFLCVTFPADSTGATRSFPFTAESLNHEAVDVSFDGNKYFLASA